MTRIRNWIVLAILLCSCSSAFGQAVHTNRTNSAGKSLDYLEGWDLTLTPARETKPVLKYSLWVRSNERRYGDATPYYYRAMLMNAQLPGELAKQYTDRSEKWLAEPLDEMTKAEMRAWLAFHRSVVHELATAAYREKLDLDLRFRDLQGPEAVSFLLPDAQSMRSLAKMLQVKVHLEIAERRFDEAIETLRIGYQLGQATAATPTLVNALVGLAVSGMMTNELTRLIAQPGAPNMYWAMAALPHPLIDLRKSLEAESELPLQVFPFLRDAETAHRTADEWRRLMLDSYLRLHELSGDYQGKPGPLTEATATELMTKGYAGAKEFLLAQGMTAQQVESMPMGQTLAIHAARTYRYIYDEMFKWALLPPAEVQDRWSETTDRFRREGFLGPQGWNKEKLSIAEILLPSAQPAWYAPLRLERQLAAIRAIEAIRMHAADHAGELPKSLEEIRIAAVPNDPLYNRPFEYRLEGKSAVLETLPRSGVERRDDVYRYRLTIHK